MHDRPRAAGFPRIRPTTVDEEWGTFDGGYTAYDAGGQLTVHANPAAVIGRGATALDRFDSTATPLTAYQALASLPSGPAALIAVVSAHVAELNPNQVLSPVEQYAPTSASEDRQAGRYRFGGPHSHRGVTSKAQMTRRVLEGLKGQIAKKLDARPWPPRGAVVESLAISELKSVSGPGRR